MSNKVSAEGEDKEGEVKELNSVQNRNHTIYKVLKHACIVGVWLSMGMSAGVVGPTLPDLAKDLNVNYEEIGSALSGKSIGVFTGSLLGGFLHELFYKHTELVMSLGILCGAMGTMFIPRVGNLDLMGFMLSLTGFSQGIINTGGNTLVLHLWGEEAAAPMHSVHLFYGIGSLLAPQVARPFLVDSNPRDPMTTVSPSNYTHITSLLTAKPPASCLDIPYSIMSGISILVALIMLVFYIKAPPKSFPKRIRPPLNIRSLISPGSCSGGRIWYGSSLFIFLFVYFMNATGGERAFGNYLPTYSQESSLKFTKAQSSNLATVFWSSHAFGRFSGIILSRFIPTSIIILGDILLLIFTSILLATYGFNHPIAIWVLSGLMGYGISLIFPCGMAWANIYLNMNSVGMMVLIMGASSGAVIYQYVPGYLIQSKGPKSLMWVMVTYAGLVSVTFAIMTLITKLWVKHKENRVDTEMAVTSVDKSE